MVKGNNAVNNAKYETHSGESTGFESLNDVQREAVQHKDGPLLSCLVRVAARPA